MKRWRSVGGLEINVWWHGEEYLAPKLATPSSLGCEGLGHQLEDMVDG